MRPYGIGQVCVRGQELAHPDWRSVYFTKEMGLMSFDAVSIENAFARLIGNPVGARGTSHDADVFRGGLPEQLALALYDAANALDTQVKSVDFEAADSEPGGAKARIEVAISRLKKTARAMSNSTVVSREDYRWEIIGCLVSTVAALLERAKR